MRTIGEPMRHLDAAISVRSIVGTLIAWAGVAWLGFIMGGLYGWAWGFAYSVSILALIDFGRWLRRGGSSALIVRVRSDCIEVDAPLSAEDIEHIRACFTKVRPTP